MSLESEAIGLLEEIYDEDSLAPHRSEEDGVMYKTSAKMFVLMSKLGYEVDEGDLKDAIERLQE